MSILSLIDEDHRIPKQIATPDGTVWPLELVEMPEGEWLRLDVKEKKIYVAINTSRANRLIAIVLQMLQFAEASVPKRRYKRHGLAVLAPFVLYQLMSSGLLDIISLEEVLQEWRKNDAQVPDEPGEDPALGE
jgi:hypothetical protein